MGRGRGAVVKACPNPCVATCAELAKLKMWRKEADLASAVYKPTGQRPVDGYTEVTDPAELKKLGLKPENLTPADSEFRAGVFKENGTGNYVVSYKGTTPTSFADWVQNGQQATTSTGDYYSRAKMIARNSTTMVGQGGVESVKFVGHSLGGGLASAAAHATATPATTFNAAGLHLFNRSIFNAPPVDAVRVKGEILTAVQQSIPIAPEAVGTAYRLDPPADTASALSRANLNGWDALFPVRGAAKYVKGAAARAVELHGMDKVTKSLDERRAQVEEKAKKQGCQC
jgi:hypothetical protein